MSRCVTCDTIFDEGYNPFYCSAICAEAKNRGEPESEDPHAHIRAAHRERQKAYAVPARIEAPKPVTTGDLLRRAW